MKKYAVIVAAGSGSRMGSAIPKQFLELQGKPLLWYALSTFLESFNDIDIILVLPAGYLSAGQKIAALSEAPGRILITPGGETRFQSVRNGLTLVKHPSMVFVHDGVRCLTSKALIHRCYTEALEKGNAVPAVTSTDSIRMETAGGSRVLDRNTIKLVQTPQVFRSEILTKAFEQPYQPSFTDEAAVVENAGVKINLIEGEETNIKITRPMDMAIAEKILSGSVF